MGAGAKGWAAMSTDKTDTLLLLLMGIIILLLVANLGLFLRMNQLQSQVIQALQPLQRPTGLPAGTQAPSFRLADTDGRLVSLPDFAGQRVLLAFSATTCPACQQMYPALRRFHESHPDIALLMISRGSSEENRRLVQNEGLTFPILTWEDDVVKAYQVPGTSYFYVIDGQGVIAAQGFTNSLEQLEEMVKASR
jgi:methylamine dehydrogenase accessory protein MauD